MNFLLSFLKHVALIIGSVIISAAATVFVVVAILAAIAILLPIFLAFLPFVAFIFAFIYVLSTIDTALIDKLS